jgi:hypothetical protein
MQSLRKIIFFLFLFSALSGSAQYYNDMGLWTSVYVEKRLVKGLLARGEVQGRMNRNISNYYYTNFDIGLTYKPLNWVNFSGAYVVNYREPREGDKFEFRDQYYAYALLKVRVAFLRFMDRNMFQSKLDDTYGLESLNITSRNNYYRNKFTVKLDLTRRLTPYVAQEVYIPVNGVNRYFVNRTRSFAGLEIMMTKHSQLELFYLFQRDWNRRSIENNHVAGIAVSFAIK